MKPITFILFAYNEEKRIAYAVRSFMKYGPVLIMDGGSTDKTKEIAEKLGATFLSRPTSNVPHVETQQNYDFIKKNTNTPWIYWGYVDNIAPKTLVEKMLAVATENSCKQIIAPMHTYMWGATNHIAQKSHIPVAFHRDYMDFTHTPIHSMGLFTGTPEEVCVLPSLERFAIRHFSTYVTSKYVVGYLRYAEEEALQKFKNGERFSILKLFAAMLRYMWIYRRSMYNGRVGIIVMLNAAFGRLMTYARLYEIEHNITLQTAEEKYALEKEKLLNAKSS
ncbi:hypothetical protein A3C87_03205 [Candidatus Kaiserbacteria bacterium RIFCSPHIGHO2_02_FULL_49_34]|uniref:Glycosyltransferase 2-like domain-containing protein n=1 Tax=Candidatus Kaiserbacteria bacterium RIFCSPHIGHO2_02_FULL_49_34 TaxID=1798491 RepID=A0A1F6DI93_9BACT|nr:MAG: hypothetical protein A3C87_03205 [Candidatus Kaiserbacteria bacterium RIFCSPHIGHO2_02_FULL_49_34]